MVTVRIFFYPQENTGISHEITARFGQGLKAQWLGCIPGNTNPEHWFLGLPSCSHMALHRIKGNLRVEISPQCKWQSISAQFQGLKNTVSPVPTQSNKVRTISQTHGSCNEKIFAFYYFLKNSSIHFFVYSSFFIILS